jgi:hypothetical protein
VFPAEAANYPTGDAYVDSLSEAEQDALAEAEDAYLASLSAAEQEALWDAFDAAYASQYNAWMRDASVPGVLKACLVDGYGDVTPAGWQVAPALDGPVNPSWPDMDENFEGELAEFALYPASASPAPAFEVGAPMPSVGVRPGRVDTHEAFDLNTVFWEAENAYIKEEGQFALLGDDGFRQRFPPWIVLADEEKFWFFWGQASTPIDMSTQAGRDAVYWAGIFTGHVGGVFCRVWPSEDLLDYGLYAAEEPALACSTADAYFMPDADDPPGYTWDPGGYKDIVTVRDEYLYPYPAALDLHEPQLDVLYGAPQSRAAVRPALGFDRIAVPPGGDSYNAVSVLFGPIPWVSFAHAQQGGRGFGAPHTDGTVALRGWAVTYVIDMQEAV